MPQAIYAVSSSRDGKKRRGYEAALSPRSSPPEGPPMATQERLPPISSLLPNLPPPSERAVPLGRERVGRETATGPRSAIPARFSPPPASRRIQSSCETSNGASGSLRHIEDRTSSRSLYEGSSNYQLPIHAGRPSGRTVYAPSTLEPPPVSPYATHQTDARRSYPNGDSHSGPSPPSAYRQSLNGHAAAPHYPAYRDHRNGDAYEPAYISDVRNGDHRNGHDRNGGPSTYHAPHPRYQQMQYGYSPAASPSTNGNYAIHHQYQNGYHHGSVQFESDESGGHAPRRRRGNLPRDTTDMLKQWFQDHLGHPYPTEDEKQYLCRQTGLQMTQISNWFINARRRRIPELVSQATAETLLRENSGDSSGSSNKG